MRSRRINYNYLNRLKERLQDLDISFDDLPSELLYLTWEHHRRYLTEILGLDYCILCKLPIFPELRAEDRKDLCKVHAANFSRGRRGRRFTHYAVTPEMIESFKAREAIRLDRQRPEPATAPPVTSNDEIPTTKVELFPRPRTNLVTSFLAVLKPR